MQKLPFNKNQRESYKKHRREVRNRIILPMLFATVLTIGLFVLVGYAAFGNGADVARWSAVATILMSLPALVVLLIIFALVVLMIYGMNRLLKSMPKYTGMVQDYAYYLSGRVVQINKQITAPVIQIKAWLSLFSREGD